MDSKSPPSPEPINQFKLKKRSDTTVRALFCYNLAMNSTFYSRFAFLVSFLFILVSSFSFLVSPALAQSAWSGRCVSQGDVATIQGVECLFGNVLQVVVILAGLAFLFMFVTGGFQYLTGAGDGKKLAAAASTLTMSIIGLLGTVGSVLILKLIRDFTGVNVLLFFIPG